MFHGFPKRVERLKNTPTWAFHGANDDLVPLAESQKLVEALRESGGMVKFTVYPHAGHDSWTETYNNPECIHGFLAIAANTRRKKRLTAILMRIHVTRHSEDGKKGNHRS